MNINSLDEVTRITKKLNAMVEAQTSLSNEYITLEEAINLVKGLGPAISATELQNILTPIKNVLATRIVQAKARLTQLGVDGL